MASANKEASESLKRVFRLNLKRFLERKEVILTLSEEQSVLANSLKNILKTLKALKEQDSSISLDDLEIPAELRIDFKPSTSIGDATEAILKEYNSLTIKEIIEKLRKLNVRISEKNARIILYNAITRDSQKRFKITKDKKVVLTNEK